MIRFLKKNLLLLNIYIKKSRKEVQILYFFILILRIVNMKHQILLIILIFLNFEKKTCKNFFNKND